MICMVRKQKLLGCIDKVRALVEGREGLIKTCHNMGQVIFSPDVALSFRSILRFVLGPMNVSK